MRRGYDEAEVILGEDYSGVLERDGWAPYRRFKRAGHQSCYAHLLRRTSEMISDSIAGQARVPHPLRQILKDGLALRDARDQGELAAPELDEAVKLLDARIEKLLACQPTHPPNVRLLRHLRSERGNLTTFLKTAGVQATNWRAEQALRPAIVNRKNWGGNRTWAGARTQQVTMSVIRTARQQHVDPINLMLEARLGSPRSPARASYSRSPRALRRPNQMAARKPPARPKPRYRVVCYELIGEDSNVIMDDTSAGFIAATGNTGTITRGVMTAELLTAGPHDVQAHLAITIADDELLARLTGRHTRPRPR